MRFRHFSIIHIMQHMFKLQGNVFVPAGDNWQPELESSSKVGARNVSELPAAILSFAISATYGGGCSVMS
jgi:hypothetical protein